MVTSSATPSPAAATTTKTSSLWKGSVQGEFSPLVRALCFAFVLFALVRDVSASFLNPHSNPYWWLPPLWLFKSFSIVATVALSQLGRATLHSVVPYYLAYIVPIIVVHSCLLGRYWDIVKMIFIFVPLMEISLGIDVHNPLDAEEEAALLAKPGFKLATLLWVPAQYIVLVWSFWVASTWDVSGTDFVGLCMSIGLMNGALGINIAHELFHKNNAFEVNCGKALLVGVCYGHFYIEHVWGHHKNVSTPYDVASAVQGDNYYSFLPRSLYHSFMSAWHIEAERLATKSTSKWNPLHNQIIQMVSASFAILVLAYVFFGVWAAVLFVAQSVFADILLEAVNYIEHYGLRRKELSAGSGEYEPVNILHSWNAKACVTNFILFKLMRHSDHHAFASRRYQILRSFDESPQMPTGYAGMLLLCLIPPLWFAVMDPEVQSYQKRLDAEWATVSAAVAASKTRSK